MIQTNNVSYKIGEKIILNGISVNFLPGQLTLIIGPNGAGKSTLVKLICQQIKPSNGTILLGNQNLQLLSTSALAMFRSVLSQNVELAFPLKVSEVVMMGRYPHFSSKPTVKDLEACEAAMQFFDVLEMRNRDYMTLSGGEKQRVHFARVVAQIWYPMKDTCRYLILDEPLTFLDVHYQFHFMHKLLELLKQKDVVIIGVVHDLNLAAKFADNIVLLHQGEVLASGTAEDVLTAEYIRTAYRLEPIIHKVNKQTFLFFE